MARIISLRPSGFTMPSFASETPPTNALVPLKTATPGQLTYSGNGLYQVKGRIPLTADAIATKSFSEGTFLIALKQDSSSAQLATCLNTPTLGALTYYDLGLGIEDNRVRMACPGLDNSNGLTAPASFSIQGDNGYCVLAVRFNASTSEKFYNKVGIGTGTGTGGTPIAIPYFMAGGSGFVDGYPFSGEVAILRGFDTMLSDADIIQETQAMLDDLSIQGFPITRARNFLALDGDSNGFGHGLTKPSNSFFNLQTLQFSNPHLKMKNYAVDGAVLGATDGSTSNSLFQRLPKMLRTITTAKAAGFHVIAGCMIGTNDMPTAPNTAAYIASLETYWSALRTAGADAVIGITPPSRTDGLIANFETLRTSNFSPAVLASTVPNAFCDISSNTYLGGLNAANSTTYFFGDKVHLNESTGHPLAAGLLTTAITPFMI
jgi:hypothetical protein